MGKSKRSLLLPLLLLGACGTNWFSEQRGQKDALDGDQNYWFEMDATRRSGFVIYRDGEPMVLSEPAPDALLSRETELYAKLVETISSATASETSLEGRLRLIETANELKSRHESVMVLREALYRLSEMAFNGYLDMAKFCDGNLESHSLLAEGVDTVSSTPKRAERAARVEQLFRRTMDAIENTFKPVPAPAPATPPAQKPPALDLNRTAKEGEFVLNTTVIAAAEPELLVVLRSKGEAKVGLQVTGATVKNGKDDLPKGVEINEGKDGYFGVALATGTGEAKILLKLKILPGVTEVALGLRAGTSSVGEPIRIPIR